MCSLCRIRDSSKPESTNNTQEFEKESPANLHDSFGLSSSFNCFENIDESTVPMPKSPINEDQLKVSMNLSKNYSTLPNNCHCSCGVLVAELDGIKLDIVILKNSIESRADLRNEKSKSDNGEIDRLKRELSNEKAKSNQLEADLLLIVKERNSEVDDLNKIINSLENKAIKSEEIIFTLRHEIDVEYKTSYAKLRVQICPRRTEVKMNHNVLQARNLTRYLIKEILS